MRKDKKELLLFWDLVAPSQTDVVAFYDTFTDTNGTLLTDHVPDINIADASWAIFADETFSILNDQAIYNPVSPENAKAYIDINQSNVVVRTRFQLGAGGDPSDGGILLRMSEDGVHYIQLDVDPEEDDTTLSYAASTDSVLFTSSGGNVIEMTATCSGNSIIGEVSNISTGESATLQITENILLANTKFGLLGVVGAGPEPTPIWDWFEIRR